MKKTKTTFVGEWVKTNDKVRVKPNGNFEYISRTDDLIKINGQFVSPIEIESVLMALPLVDDCAVVAVKNERGMTKIHAFLVVNATITTDDLKTYLRQILPYYKIPTQFMFIDSLPKTVTNKKIRSLLRETIESVC